MVPSSYITCGRSRRFDGERWPNEDQGTLFETWREKENFFPSVTTTDDPGCGNWIAKVFRDSALSLRDEALCGRQGGPVKLRPH